MQIDGDNSRFRWGRWLRGERGGAAGDRFGDEGRSRSAAPTGAAISVAVASGKGGTGKSFLATNLAIAAARRGLRATLVDCDYGLAVDHLLVGVHPVRTLQHLLEGRAGAQACRSDTPFGLRLVAGVTGISEFANLGRVQLGRLAHAFEEWSSDQDLLVLDAGAGLGQQSLATVAAAEHVIVVVQPEIASLTDAYALVKCLVRRPPPVPQLSVVMNRVVIPQQAASAYRRLDGVSRQFLGVGLGYLGAISEEPAVTPRRLGQAPLVVSHPGCRTAQEIGAILDALSVATGGLCSRPVPAGGGIDARFMAGLVRPGS